MPAAALLRRPAVLLTAGLVALAAAGCWHMDAQSKTPAQPRAVTPRGALDADENNNINVFKKTSPSVVHITNLALQRDLFSLRVTEQPQGTGTGFIWDENGHIVTNFHVIQGANAATVTLSDQSVLPAKLVGAFPDRDIAVLRIDVPKDKLAPIAIGTSRELQVGQKVYAIGNPFGLDQTLTTGIVSALNREIESVTRRTIKGAIQTDAAINPGNSGGPLLDSAGRLIGVNTSIYSPSGASAGIGFAIPVDEVNRIVPRLIRDGRFIRPALGVTAGAAQLTQSLGAPKGVLLVGVVAGGPAAQAGLQPYTRGRDGRIVAGDVITAVNEQPVADLDDMLGLLEQRQIGEKVVLSVWRAGQTRRVNATLGSSD
ncbi:trypsin-like peptidase domain-containing protein [Roseateles sp. DJS-2-20]|uniref:Trypsin-like peptidase domain-containing protein n=2 Tax=Roseateles paludis TaxID=3145238 RepID=A0ABV0G348_9BURK